jgi:hypothetical protein
LLLATWALTGCAGLGKSDFACPGYPSEPLCLSTAEVYRLSLSGAIPRPVKPRKDGGRNAKTSSEELF